MTLAVSFWVGNILGQTFASVVALLCLPRWWAVAILLLQVSMHMRFWCIHFPFVSRMGEAECKHRHDLHVPHAGCLGDVALR